MGYYTLNQGIAEEFAHLVYKNGACLDRNEIDTFVARYQTTTTGSDLYAVDLAEIYAVADQSRIVIANAVGRSDVDQIEGELSVKVYQALKDRPIDILDDPGFWRFLSVSQFAEFICWRESKALSKENNINKYFTARNNADSLPLRMFLRGQIAVESGNDKIAGLVPKATDLWRSHIVRVSTGYSRDLSRALVESQDTNHVATRILRDLARRINRRWSNFNMLLLDSEETKDLVNNLRVESLGDRNSDSDDSADD